VRVPGVEAVTEILGSVSQADDRGTLSLYVSEFTGPAGSSRLQLTSPGDIVSLDRASVRELYEILGTWLDGGLLRVPPAARHNHPGVRRDGP
jgi:hypothetical protein